MNDLNFINTKDAKLAIEELNEINWKSYNGGNVKTYLQKLDKILFKYFPQISLLGKHIDTSMLSDKTFYRVRFTDDIKNLKDESQYGCPDAKYVQYNQRANLKGYPVFYVSDEPLVSICETLQIYSKNKSKNGRLSIACWKYVGIEEELVFPVFSREYAELNPDTQWSLFSDESFRNIGNAKVNSDQIEALRHISDWFAESFVKDDKRSWSSALAHRAMYENSVKPGIVIYPSIQMGLRGTNYAFHPELANHKMKLVRIYHISLKQIKINPDEGALYNFDHLGCFINNNGKIDFENDIRGTEIFEKQRKEDF